MDSFFYFLAKSPLTGDAVKIALPFDDCDDAFDEDNASPRWRLWSDGKYEFDQDIHPNLPPLVKNPQTGELLWLLDATPSFGTVHSTMKPFIKALFDEHDEALNREFLARCTGVSRHSDVVFEAAMDWVQQFLVSVAKSARATLSGIQHEEIPTAILPSIDDVSTLFGTMELASQQPIEPFLLNGREIHLRKWLWRSMNDRFRHHPEPLRHGPIDHDNLIILLSKLQAPSPPHEEISEYWLHYNAENCLTVAEIYRQLGRHDESNEWLYFYEPPNWRGECETLRRENDRGNSRLIRF